MSLRTHTHTHTQNDFCLKKSAVKLFPFIGDPLVNWKEVALHLCGQWSILWLQRFLVALSSAKLMTIIVA